MSKIKKVSDSFGFIMVILAIAAMCVHMLYNETKTNKQPNTLYTSKTTYGKLVSSTSMYTIIEKHNSSKGYLIARHYSKSERERLLCFISSDNDSLLTTIVGDKVAIEKIKPDHFYGDLPVYEIVKNYTTGVGASEYCKKLMEGLNED